jgi:hypothetical protein
MTDRRNNPPISLEDFMRRELSKLARKFAIASFAFGVPLALLLWGGQ